jgi:hypothetical protein
VRDINDVLDLTLRLPIGGKTYEVQPPPANIAAHLMNLLALGIYADAGLPMDEETRGSIEVTDEEFPEFSRMCLGSTLDELTADGIGSPRLDFIVETAFLCWTVGKPFAEHHWETGGKPAGPTEKRSGRPTATRTRTAAESGTPSSASPSGTRPRSARKRPASPSSSSGADTATSSSRTSTPSTASTSTSTNP